MTDGSARVSYPSFLPNPTGYRERPCPRLMQTWAWLAKCHTEVYLASVFVTDVARTGSDENLRHRYSTCWECFPLNVPAHGNESGYLRTSSKTVSIATLHQPRFPPGEGRRPSRHSARASRVRNRPVHDSIGPGEGIPPLTRLRPLRSLRQALIHPSPSGWRRPVGSSAVHWRTRWPETFGQSLMPPCGTRNDENAPSPTVR